MVKAVSDETYCLKTQSHQAYNNGNYKVCYRCGMLLGRGDGRKLGTLLDY